MMEGEDADNRSVITKHDGEIKNTPTKEKEKKEDINEVDGNPINLDQRAALLACCDIGRAVEPPISPLKTYFNTYHELFKEHRATEKRLKIELDCAKRELKWARKQLKKRNAEIERLSRVQKDVEKESAEFTTRLLQDVHKQIEEANEKQLAAEETLIESKIKNDVLLAEVAALKKLVSTSSPNPQISNNEGGSLLTRKHRRSLSHSNLKYGRENSPVEEENPKSAISFSNPESSIVEIDPNTQKDFFNWKQTPKFDKSDPFISRVYTEDIDLCLAFNNKSLSDEVKGAIESRNIFMEPITDKTKALCPETCALLEVPRQCDYRMRFGDQDQWYNISQICRNRIISVCQFLSYLRCVEQGLVKSSVHDIYLEMTRLRHEMVLARLGFALSTAETSKC